MGEEKEQNQVDTIRRAPERRWLGGLGIGQLGRQVWREMQRDEVLGRGAQLAYFFFFAIFPLAIFLTSILGVISGPNSHVVHSLVAHITQAMPSTAKPLVIKVVHKSLEDSGSGMMAFGIVLALLSASSGMAAMIQMLNAVYEVKEERSLLKQRLMALELTVGVGLLMCAAIFLITAGGKVANAVAGGIFYTAWQVFEYPIAIAFLLFGFALVYYYAPNQQRERWRWVTPGATGAVVIWAAGSFGLRLYLRHFNSYTSDYGTAGTVMVLLLWFYITGLAFLVGGEIDAAIERAASGRQKGGARRAVEPGRAA